MLQRNARDTGIAYSMNCVRGCSPAWATGFALLLTALTLAFMIFPGQSH
jgi:hypothetical protein